jgi:sulfur-oxidizing protein SoxY
MTNRRAVLTLAGGALALVTLRPLTAREADRLTYQEAVRAIAGGREPNDGRVTLDLPKIAETGNSVPVTVRVDSPMTQGNHVARIHLLSMANPRPQVATFHLGPRAGLAEVGTRIKLSRTQQVVAMAEMSDGSLWRDQASIVVTLGACVEEIWLD